MDSPYLPPIPDQQKPKVAGLAIASLVCGLLGFVTAGLSGIAAVITGHMAISAINKSGGALAGRGMSITGLITGYLTILILPIAILAGLALPVIMKNKMIAERVECISNVRQIGLALFEFEREYGTFPSDDLATDEEEFAGLTGVRLLDQLEAAGMVTEIDRLLAVGTRWNGDWLYSPGGTTSASGDPPVLISPEIDGKRIVLRVDRSVVTVAEADVSVVAMSAVEVKSMDLSNAVASPAPPKRK
jgi:hypothetical protein